LPVLGLRGISTPEWLTNIHRAHVMEARIILGFSYRKD